MKWESEPGVAAGTLDKRPDIPSRSPMRKAPLIVLSVALTAALVYGVIITGERDALNTELTSVQSALASTQGDLSSTTRTLIITQSELGSTRQTLASTQLQLSVTMQALTSTQAELTSTNQKLSSVQSDLSYTRARMDVIDTKLKLYENTTGSKIYSGVQPQLRGARPIELVNNPAATDPTWQQLMSFLGADPTDDRIWTEGVFVSGDFAQVLHNNAEAAGIRAALVGVFFERQTIGHGLNAFKTADRGLVYVDSTGPTLEQSLRETLYRINGGTPIEWDKIAYMVKGKEYGIISIKKANSPEYSYYERVGKALSDWGRMGIVDSIQIYW